MVAWLEDDILEEVAYSLAVDAAYCLHVIGVQVDAVDDIVAQDACPVAIGLGVYRSLFGQNLLDLLQVAGVRLLYGILQTREEVRQSLVELLGVELCAAGQAEGQLTLLVVEPVLLLLFPPA